MFPYQNGQGFNQPLASQQTGYNFGYQQQPQQPPLNQFQPSFNQIQPLQPQRTGYTAYQAPQQPQQQQTSTFQQPQPLQSQQTGYNSFQQPQQLQSQPTGFNSFAQPQQLQTQATGFYNPPAAVNSFQPQLNLQSQQTGFASFQQPQQSAVQPAQTLQPQQTGYLAPQQTGFQAAAAKVEENTELKIPSVRLSFITSNDQTKFEHLFRAAVPKGEQAISGESAKDILLRSGLNPTTLAEIWQLSDTTVSGQLLFPEFALALHLCNVSLRGESLPNTLPEKIRNEVSSFVDAISFSIPDDPSKVFKNTPFAEPSQQQQSSVAATQPSNMQLLSSLQSQPTGYGFQPAQTGFGTSLQPQRTGPAPFAQQVQPQITGYVGIQPQQTGYQQPPVLTAQRTGPGPQPLTQQRTGGLVQQPTGLLTQQTGLIPQPTGRPGEWGFVSMPTGGLPGLTAMQSHFLPSANLDHQVLQSQMGGVIASNVTWAITKDEKSIYDGIFRAWDTSRTGTIDGEIAIQIFGKSGLSRTDLEQIWNLSDPSNKGRLNKDEFAVAMHLVYRRLNGLELPNRLPPELVPPSSKLIQDSMDTIKNSLRSDKSRSNSSVRSNGSNAFVGKTDGKRYKNDDDNVGYTSSSRHRKRTESRSEDSDSTSSSTANLSIEDLKKLVHEKQILLNAVDARDEDNHYDQAKDSQRASNEIETLKLRIKAVQDKLDQLPGNAGDAINKKKELKLKLYSLTDKVPSLISKLVKIDNEITNSKIELYRIKLTKENPGLKIEGTGPNGSVTDQDRRRAKSKVLMKQRMAALTGKPIESNGELTFEEVELNLQEETRKINEDNNKQSSIINDIETGIKDLQSGVELNLRVSNQEEVGFDKWEKGNDVQSDVRLFIQSLTSTKPAYNPVSAFNSYKNAPTPVAQTYTTSTPVASAAVPSPTAPTEAANTSSSGSVQDRKAEARRRMNERMLKLGIKRPSASQETAKEEPKPEPVVTPAVKEIPTPVATPTQTRSVPPPPPRARSTHELAPPVKPEPVSAEEESSDDDDDDDEEYLRLKKEAEAMRAKIKAEEERKQKKKDEREARKLKLKKEMEQMARSSGVNAQSEDEEEDVPAVQAKTFSASSLPTAAKTEAPIPAVSNGVPAAAAVADEVPKTAHESNPFSKPGKTETVTPANSTAAAKNNNPFFKPENKEPVFDANAAAAQRASQRGQAPDDDWGDSDKESSEDEMPTRSGAAHLANLLFGGMAPPPRTQSQTSEINGKNDSSVPTPKEVTPEVAPKVQETIPPVPQVPTALIEDDEAEEFIDSVSTPVPEVAPSFPDSIPPIPTSFIPPIPGTSAPEVPNGVPPPLPETSIPAPPPLPNTTAPPAPPIPNGIPPPPPPFPTSAAPPPPPFGAPPPPPPPPSSSAPASSGAPDISSLLGQINLGTKLKKVDSTQQKISTGGVIGKVL